MDADAKKKRALEIMEQIRQVLLHDWDPIGVSDVPEAQDEYDSYIGGVYRLLASGARPKAIAQHLATIQGDTIGLPVGTYKDLMPVARKLHYLEVRLESG
jgi:hypothetical protein